MPTLSVFTFIRKPWRAMGPGRGALALLLAAALGLAAPLPRPAAAGGHSAPPIYMQIDPSSLPALQRAIEDALRVPGGVIRRGQVVVPNGMRIDFFTGRILTPTEVGAADVRYRAPNRLKTSRAGLALYPWPPRRGEPGRAGCLERARQLMARNPNFLETWRRLRLTGRNPNRYYCMVAADSSVTQFRVLARNNRNITLEYITWDLR